MSIEQVIGKFGEPLSIKPLGGISTSFELLDHDGNHIESYSYPSADSMLRHLMRHKHMVACTNALRGRNPDALADVVEEAEHMVDLFPGSTALKAALARLKGEGE